MKPPLCFFAFFLIVLARISTYFNSFHPSWRLDGYSFIITNMAIRISDLALNSLSRTAGLFQSPEANTRPQFRPIIFQTFVINWYTGKDQPAGYHVVNLFLDILCASILIGLVDKIRSPIY